MGEAGATDPASGIPALPAFARGPVGSALVALGVVLTATSAGYGYHRDELYFRTLPPQWGYVDQPPLAPLVVRLMSGIADEAWAVRIPATLAAVATALLVALLARELGGGRLAQGLAAWGYAFAPFPLVFGHVMFTTGVDLVAWGAVTLFVVRAVRREEPSWWLAAGAVVGLATFDKLLVAALVVSLAAGLVAVGPRHLPWRWVVAGLAVAAVLAVPALVYQATHGWPQLTMGRALSAKGAQNRIQMWPLLLLLLGPVLVPVWVAGWVALWRRTSWRSVRFLAVAFPVLLVLSAVAAGQVYYPIGLVAVMYAAGCVPVSQWLARVAWQRRVVLGAVAVNALVASVIALPLVPASVVGSTPVPGINQAARDQVGWPAYVAQVARVRDGLTTAERDGAIVVTNNYGETGAIARYGPPLGLPSAMSGQNELFFLARPPATRAVAIVVGRSAGVIAARNASCEVVARLDNGVHVANEEQGQPVSVCRGARQPWDAVWPQFQHYD